MSAPVILASQQAAPPAAPARQESLRRRSVRAAATVASSQVVSILLRFTASLLLTRLLMPEAFGLVALVNSLVVAVVLLSDSGAGVVIIQSRRNDEAFLATAWTLQVIRGVALWLLVGVMALAIAGAQSRGWFSPGTVYASPELPAMLFVFGLTLALQGAESIQCRIAEREIRLGRVAAIDLASQVLGLAAAVILAQATRSPWSLMFGAVAAAAAKALLSHACLQGPGTRFGLQREAVRELLGKGKWIVLSSALGFLALQGDRTLLGMLVGSATLGIYGIAHSLATLAPTAIAVVFTRVAYPAIAEVARNNPDRVAPTYLRFQRLMDVVLGLLVGITMVGAERIVQVLYDPRYQSAGPMLQLLALGGLGLRMQSVTHLFMAQGKMHYLALCSALQALVIVVGLPIGFALFGMEGALAAVVAGKFADWPVTLWYRHRIGLARWHTDLCLPAALAIGCAAGFVLDIMLGRFGAAQL